MNRRPLNGTRALALTAMLAFGASLNGCPDGVVPVALTLSDASAGCEGQESLTKPFATGALLDIDAHSPLDPDTAIVITDATLSDPAVWSILEVDNPLRLQAQAVGVSTITVRGANDEEGTATLEVADIASATVAPWNGIQPFNLTTELAPGPADLAQQITQSGFALLPGANLRLQVVLKDADGRELGGYDVAQWAAQPDDAVTLATAEERTNDILVTHAGGAATEVTVTTVGGGSFTLATVSAGAATAIEAFVVETGVTGTSLSLPAGTTQTIVGLVYDNQGRWLVGDDGQPFDVTLLNDGIVTVAPPPWSEGEDGFNLDAAAEQLLLDNRVFYLRGVSEGSTTVTLTAAGVSVEIPVTVTAP